MSRRTARNLVTLAFAVVVAAAQGGAAKAAHVARLDVQPAQVAPGGQVTVKGPPGWAPAPVTITWNALDGPPLGTFPTTPGGNASFGPAVITVPATAAPGVYTLFGNQEVPDAQTAVRGVPARARVTVVSPGGRVPAPPPETPSIETMESLRESGSPPLAGLLFLGLGVLAVTLGAGLVFGQAARRRPAPPEARKG